MLRPLICLGLVAVVLGCQRPWYRRSADRETYAVERQHENEWRWPVASTSITAPPGSRLFDPFNPDYPPMPPDDPAAYFYMMNPDGQPPPRTYHRDGDAPWIEDPSWRASLPLDAEGYLVLAPERAVELGLLQSREYQKALEDLYLVWLRLTLERWEFAVRWFGRNNTTYSQFGAGDTAFNTLTTNTNLGFVRNFAAGGQLLVDFANSFVVTFVPEHDTATASNLSVTLIQPLLRGFGRRVRLEALTQSERDVLYAVRAFARFRKQFYVSLVNGGTGSSGYLGLLLQVQSLRNLEANLKSQEQNLRLHEALLARGTITTVQFDQAFQGYQQARLDLVRTRAALETSLDSYKQNLGLPPDLPVKLDDSILNPFQLASPRLEKLQGELDNLFAEFRELHKAPPAAALRTGFEQLKGFLAQLDKLTTEVEGELENWRQQNGAAPGTPGADEEIQRKRELAMRAALERQMPELRAELEKFAKDVDKEQAAVVEATRDEGWKVLQKRARQLIAGAAQLYVVQAQVRVFFIKLEPIPYTLPEASAYARENRLDLMNQRAQVVDFWRRIAVTANALKAGLDLKVTANVATPAASDNPFDFRASASQYTVGFGFDSPLNRKQERNLYRASLIAYQQSLRSFMALDDQIQAAVRLDIRQLETERANFNIARQSLIAAARQVEASRDTLLVLPDAAGRTSSQDVLNALSTLLQAKTTLISSWINYQNNRAQLLLDMDALRLNSRGLPDDESADYANTCPAHLGAPRIAPNQLPEQLP